jgi:hypothetical protein
MVHNTTITTTEKELICDKKRPILKDPPVEINLILLVFSSIWEILIGSMSSICFF